MTFKPPTASSQGGVSRYFIITTVVFRDHGALQEDLQELRHDIASEGFDVRSGFHASTDPQRIRDRVFTVLGRHDFAIDSTIYEKAKANPTLRSSELSFYRSAWVWHLRRVIPDRCLPTPELLLIAAEITVRAKRDAYHDALRSAMNDVGGGARYQSAFWPAATDLCIQAADYCSWAVFRKWESGDDRSYRLIAGRVGREYDLFANGSVRYL